MQRRLLAILAALLVATAGAVTAAGGPTTDPSTDVSAQTAEDCELASSTDRTLSPEGVDIAVTVHQPALDDGETAPVILHSHGWSGSRDTDAGGLVGDLVEACYGVVSIDMRGHGESAGQAHVHSPDHEIQDVIGILDWIHDELDWVTKEPDTAVEKDVVAGAIGGSYGGGYQLLTAALDDRLDALAPEITWNDLPQSLAPNGAVKSGWVDLLYAAGTAAADLAPFIHQGYAWAQAFNEFPSGDNPGEPDVRSNFVDSSPAHYEDAIDVPALFVQGTPDTLFNLNQAVDNVNQLQQAGAGDVRLVTHLGGHVIHTEGTLPGGGPAFGLQPAPGQGVCGDLHDKIVAWYDHHLKDAADPGIDPVELALDDGQTCLTDGRTEALVLGDDPGTTVDLDGPVAVTQGAGPATGYAEAGPLTATAASPVQIEVTTADGQAAITGAAELEATATVAGEGAIAYLSLVADDGQNQRVLASQVTPLRLDGPATDVEVSLELGGVAAALEDGETVSLQISTADAQYAHNAQRVPGGLVLEDLTLDIPIQPSAP